MEDSFSNLVYFFLLPLEHPCKELQFRVTSFLPKTWIAITLSTIQVQAATYCDIFSEAEGDECKRIASLANCCCVQLPRPADAEQIHRAAAKVRDWDSVLKLAQEHRVSSMLFSRIADMGPAVPLIVQHRLRAEYDSNMFHNLANAVELIAVLELLEHEMIPAMPFKGRRAGSVYLPRPHDTPRRRSGSAHPLQASQASHELFFLERGYELNTSARADGTPFDPIYTYEYRFGAQNRRNGDGAWLET